MAKKKVCCSFDYENDRHYYNLLEAWNENENIDFSINDCTPSEIQSESISKIKQVLRQWFSSCQIRQLIFSTR